MPMAAGYSAKSMDKIRIEHQQIEQAFMKLRDSAYYRDSKLVAPLPSMSRFVARCGQIFGVGKEKKSEKSE